MLKWEPTPKKPSQSWLKPPNKFFLIDYSSYFLSAPQPGYSICLGSSLKFHLEIWEILSMKVVSKCFWLHTAWTGNLEHVYIFL